MSLVEYHDPDGLFPLISSHLQSRLPLRNLHWKSASRPLRSINSLHVDFIPSSAGHKASDGGNVNQAPRQSRRHQLPGLCPTPYLRIYLLRCDDKEQYKSARRNVLSEWLRENTLSTQTSSPSHKLDNHNAFEWLVLHVVFPNTAASAEGRWKPSSSDGEAPIDKTSTNHRWPGRPPRTLLERLKADFNQSGKSAPDRVAQVRLAKDARPPEFIAPKSDASEVPSYDTSQEQETSWTDLVSKMKSLILMSFNLRVAQYEDDIREKEAQRTLPGWNFCTFFVLKEGLARAFDSVGLVEDALACYDELSAGLDMFLEEQTDAGFRSRSDVLLSHTSDMQTILLCMLDQAVPDAERDLSVSRFKVPFDAGQKPYREMIASNNISLFDFRCYLFARQLELFARLVWPSLLPRLSGEEPYANPALDGLKQDPDIENSEFLAPLCQLAGKMVTFLARLLRSDLWDG